MKAGIALAFVLCFAVVALFPRAEANEVEAKTLHDEEGDQLSTDVTGLGIVALKRSSRKLKETKSEETAVAEAEGTELDHDPAGHMMRDLKGKYYYDYIHYVYFYYYKGKKYYFTKAYYYYKGKVYYCSGYYYYHGKKYYYYKKAYRYYITHH